MSTSSNIDINTLSLMDEVVEVDGNVDAEQFFSPPLADDGEHEVFLGLGNRGIKADRQREGKGTGNKTGPGFLNIHLQLKGVAQNGSESGTVAFDNISTIVMETNVGKTSRAHMLMDVAGFPIRERTLGGIMQEISNAIAQKPKVTAVTRWEAQVNRGTKEKPEYENVCVGQKNFPPLLDKDGGETGRHNPEVMDAKSGQLVRAQVRVVRYGRLG